MGLVEAVQQPRDGGFARAGGADDGEFMARRDLEADAVEDGALRGVAELHVFEPHGGLMRFQRPIQRIGVGTIPDLRGLLQNAQQPVHIGQGIADGAIDDAEEVEGNEQLQHQGVDHDQIAQAHASVDDLAGGERHDGGDAQGDDGPLAEVEGGHRDLGGDGGVFPLFQGIVVATHFVGFVAEVLDGLEIDEAVEGLGIGLGIQLVHGVTPMHAPVGDFEREQHVHGHGAEDDDGEVPVEGGDQQDGDKTEFHRHRQDLKDHVVEQRGDRLGPPLQVTGNAAGASFQVVAQGEIMQVGQSADGNPPHGPVTHPCEQGVA